MTRNGKERKLEIWKQGLLDVSRRNKMINYRRTRRGSLQLLSPDYATLFDRLVGRGESLTFKRAADCSSEPQIGSLLFLMNQMGHPIEIATGEIGTSLPLEESSRTLKNLRTKARLSQEEQGINILYLSFGFLEWKRNPSEQPMRAPLVLVPVSLAADSLNSPWKLSRLGVEAPPRCASADIPPVRARMLPARAERAAHLENAARWGGAEEVVVNPTLAYVLSSEFGMELPELGAEHSVCQPRSSSGNAAAAGRAHSKLEAYLAQVEAVVSPLGWRVIREVDLALLSFLKIVMYKDLEKNRERILAHPVVSAFCGDLSGLPSPSLQPVGRCAGEGCGYMHEEEPPLDTWQVVDADSSQMDAIRLSKEGYSFVLQGPPGTGKSQTITNIIAQGLADGKRILFVSEKMAALSVVYRRLQEVQLDGYCLSLHNYRADKKEVLASLAAALDAPGQKLKTGALDFVPEYAAQRKELNGYFTGLHTVRKPLGRTLYDVLTELCTLEQVPLCSLSESVMEQSGEEYRLKLAALQRYQEFLDNYAQQSPDAQREGRSDHGGRSGLAGCGRQQQPIIDENIHSGADAFAGDGQQHQTIDENPWRDSRLGAMTYDLRMSISQTLSALEPELAALLAFRDFLWKKESRAAKKRFTMDARDWKWKDYTDFIQSVISAKLLEAAGQIDGRYSENSAENPTENSVGNSASERFENLRSESLEGLCSEPQDEQRKWFGTAISADSNGSFAEACWKMFSADDRKGLPAEIWEKTFALAVSRCKKEFDHWLAVYEKTLIGGEWISFWMQKELRKGKDEDSEKNEESKKDKASETDTAGEMEALPDGFVRRHQQMCRIMSQAADCRRKLEAESEKLSEIFSFVCCVNREIHMEYHSVRDGLERIRRIVRILLIPYNYRLAWVTEYGLEKVRTLAKTVEALTAREKAQAQNLRTEWKDGFLNLDGETLLRRFSRESTSFLGRLGSRYRADRELLISMRKPSVAEPYSTSFRSANIPRDASRRGLNDCPQDDQSPHCASDTKLEDSQLRAGLELLAAYQKTKKELEEKSREAKRVLIGHYRGADTDWVKLYQDLDACEEIEVYQKKYGITPELKKLLENRYDTRRYVRLNGKWVEEFSDGKWFDACERVLEPYKNASSTLFWSVSDASASQDRTIPDSHPARDIPASDAPASQGRTEEDVPAILEHLKRQTALLQSLEDAWDALLKTVQQSALPEPLAVFTSWFSKDLLSELTLEELYERVKDCRDLEQLNSWLLYRSILDDCEEKGLGAVIANVEKSPETARYIANVQKNPETAPDGGFPAIYRKSFLTKWALHWLNSEEMRPFALFQSYSYENLIARFRENDRRLIELTRIRLNEKLSAQRPSGHQLIVNGRDELAILRRETEKKRRVMPLRRLFKEIPHLLQQLKPCFMMSPLSVSYFLDSDAYEFDLVIFDEASQIRPEDAIGAIYRGKQVIIAGDSRQMPPTSFFTASVNNVEKYDSVESGSANIFSGADPSGTQMAAGSVEALPGAGAPVPDPADELFDPYYDPVGESILDEASRCLPSCTLLMHYRSRDESLIAFSNREIYGNRLITFPNCENLADKGLEYIYVPGGIYEGGGKNCNTAEAARCVELLAEHIRKHPERSLGIIAFSEKQQAVIEDAVLSFRMQNPQYESFFDEEKEEPFFVKNLENVQGDERDTILLSICYAKNKNGRMYLRFGPLGQPGGERRLNVAITRAKYNVKLVGSILPKEIPLREDSPEGVRMLYDYICFAMKNDHGLPEGHPLAEASDAFADRICDFLTENGYQCRRNVGASEYKVDIAVLYPAVHLKNAARWDGAVERYAAGIECDGRNYASARTARERDCLRGEMMESMGWRMFHVWSLAWYQNPEKEKRRLLEFLAKAVKETG